MRKTLCILSVAVAVVMGLLAVRATTSAFIGNLATMNATSSNSAAVVVGTFSLPRITLTIQQGGLTSTGALSVALQMTTDGANFSTLCATNPASTNAGTWSWSPTLTNQVIYYRVVTTTTNSVQVGGTWQY
jgi:hypothetical protein